MLCEADLNHMPAPPITRPMRHATPTGVQQRDGSGSDGKRYAELALPGNAAQQGALLFVERILESRGGGLSTSAISAHPPHPTTRSGNGGSAIPGPKLRHTWRKSGGGTEGDGPLLQALCCPHDPLHWTASPQATRIDKHPH